VCVCVFVGLFVFCVFYLIILFCFVWSFCFLSELRIRVSTPLESPGFFCKMSRTWKVLEKILVMESPGIRWDAECGRNDAAAYAKIFTPANLQFS